MNQWTDGERLAELAMTASRHQHYQNAPIHEAILEFTVGGVDPSRTADLQRVLTLEGYPRLEPEHDLTLEVQAQGDELVGNAGARLLGYRAVREDGRRVVRAHTERFSFSWLRPYESWEPFIEEALTHWERYRQTATPTAITRIGIRFINRLDIKRSSVEINDYLRTAVDISPYLPQTLSGYLFQIEIPLLKHDAVTRVTSTIAQPEHPDTTSIVLDLDTWRLVSLELGDAGTEDAILGHLKDLRILKNYVFEACITDATRGLIE